MGRGRTLVLGLAALGVAARLAAAEPLVDALATDDPRALAEAVTAIERAPSSPALADALFAAARACEDRLVEPARALALYDRILRDLPDARVATAAQRRADQLRTSVGPGAAHAVEATALARLIAEAKHLTLAEIERRADALADAPWPGAPEAALWLADHLRERRAVTDATRRYEAISRRWPDTPTDLAARRGAAGTAIDAGAWDRAATLARALPATDPTDRVLRDDLLDAARAGRTRGRIYGAAWVVLLGALAGLLASLADACLRGGRRVPRLRPPIEVLYMLPGAVVLVGVGFTGNLNVAPVVTAICAGGLMLAWLSGAALDVLRGRGRDVRRRAAAHAVAIALAAVALGYVAMVRGGLLEMLIETVRFGPEG